MSEPTASTILHEELESLRATLDEVCPGWFEETEPNNPKRQNIVFKSVCLPIRAAIKLLKSEDCSLK